MPDGKCIARSGNVRALADELAGLFAALIERQMALRAVVGEKLAAMRKADVNGMLAAAQREGEETQRAAEQDRRREDIVTRLCHQAGLKPGIRGTGVTLRRLLEFLEPADRRRLALSADRLRGEMLKLAEANRVVELVCRGMLAHFKAMFTAMMKDDEAPPTYSADGEMGLVSGARVFDAMG